VSEYVAIWVAGAVVLLLVGFAAFIFLRFTAVGREQELSFADVAKILVVCVGFGCAAYTLLVLAF
jgi:hypothetical protein